MEAEPTIIPKHGDVFEIEYEGRTIYGFWDGLLGCVVFQYTTEAGGAVTKISETEKAEKLKLELEKRLKVIKPRPVLAAAHDFVAEISKHTHGHTSMSGQKVRSHFDKRAVNRKKRKKRKRK